MLDKHDYAILATHESRELSRLRNSTSFRIGVLITNLIKKPWRILRLPYDIVRVLIDRLPEHVSRNCDGLIVIGLDTKGQYHSQLVTNLYPELKTVTDIHFVTTSLHGPPLENHTIIPGPRKMKNNNPKGWNLMIERYVSSYVANNNIGKIILVSDYPFKGVLDVIKSNPNIDGCWIKTKLPHDLEIQTNHAQSEFDLVIDSDKIALAVVNESKDRLPLQKRKGRLNIVIDLPAKLEEKSDDLVDRIRKIVNENFEVDIYQITYGSDKEIERSIPNKFLEQIDWRSVDLIICDGSIRSQRIVDNSDCHVLCIPNKKLMRDRQIERFNRKGLNEDIIILPNPHELAIIDALENVLITRPSNGENRREISKSPSAKISLDILREWII